MSIRKILLVSFLTASLTAPVFADPCDSIPGNWTGYGVINIASTQCNYSGSGVITANGSNAYNVALDFKTTDGGSALCPAINTTVSATCSNGEVKITTSGVNLSGTTDGNNMTFRNGDIYNAFLIQEIVLNKQQ